MNLSRQRGAALLLAVLIVILAGLAMLLPGKFAPESTDDRTEQENAVLALAREALLGFSLGTLGGALRPGDMMFPDALSKTESPRNYDGRWDGGCYDRTKADGTLITSGADMRCLGRLPWRDLGLQLPDQSENDPTGIMPWYAVSANLVDPCLKAINPGILNLTYPGSYPPACPATPTETQLPHPWLTVRDSHGNIVSDRVAFVVILPGPALGNQTRPPSPNLGGANQYLDSYVVRFDTPGCPNGSITPCVFSNHDLDNDFIIGNSKDPQNTFNDRLIYVTIDELVAAAEYRALREAAARLRDYFRDSAVPPAPRYYPYASPLGDSFFNCQEGLRRGHLPLSDGCQCYCTQSECGCRNCPGGTLEKAVFIATGGSFINQDGACTKTAINRCECLGNGWCGGSNLYRGSASVELKSPLATRVAMTAPKGSTTISGDAPFAVAQGACALAAGSCSCAGSGLSSETGSCSSGAQSMLTSAAFEFKDSTAGRFAITQTSCAQALPVFPAWFTDNGWARHIYYTADASCLPSSPGCATPVLAAGNRQNLHALLIGTGAPLQVSPPPAPKQVGYPSTTLADYLDSPENRNGNDVYDGSNTPMSPVYNDKTLIVCPGEASCP